MERKDYKIYVIGPAKGYARWIEGSLVNNMNQADVVVLTGGEDISPSLYGEPNSRPTHVYIRDKEANISERDSFELEAYQEARSLDLPIWGTCRGAQFLCAMAGGKLVQDMNHYGNHTLHFNDKSFNCQSNSLHHQLQFPYPIPKDEYNILAYTYGLSDKYFGTGYSEMIMPEKTENGVIKEPEFIYYSKIRGLGIQGHPEMMSEGSDMVLVCRAYLNLLVDRVLDDVLALNIPVKELISRAWNFKFTHEEKELLQAINNKKERKVEAVLV